MRSHYEIEGRERNFGGSIPPKFDQWCNPTGLEVVQFHLDASALWGGTIPPHLRPSKDGVLPNEVGKDEEGTLP